MFRVLRRYRSPLLGSFLFTGLQSKENYDTQNETGFNGLKKIFEWNEIDGMSTELNAIYQSGFLGFLVGAVYGGVMHSKKAYLDFMESNQATSFSSHFEAKRKLQDAVTVNFAKGALKWGWRVSLFTTSYVTITTAIPVYRGHSSLLEYVTAGGVTGSIFKINLGFRGIVVGGILGSFLGGIAGGFSLLLLKLSGTSMQDIRRWQYSLKIKRDEDIRECYEKGNDSVPEIIKLHDEKAKNSNPSDL